MVHFTSGNLLDAQAEAIINTVNTVGVMGKGIALMFKERFPENFEAYAAACKAGEVRVGEMFVTQGVELGGPRWIINFPTKKHWRYPTKLEWLKDGLVALKNFLVENNVKSVAVPPLGCGNGGLDWQVVRPLIKASLSELDNVEVLVYEPTKKYQNIVKEQGVEKLTVPRALIAEMVRRYELMGFDCSLLEIQKIAWFLERTMKRLGLQNILDLRFQANRYGPFANRLKHLLNNLDGSYLNCDRRLSDATAEDIIRFNPVRRDQLETFFRSDEAKPFLPVIEATEELIDGFQSPVGMEALATVDWLVSQSGVEPALEAVKKGLQEWPTGREHAARKEKLFSDRLLNLTIKRLSLINYNLTAADG